MINKTRSIGMRLAGNVLFFALTITLLATIFQFWQSRQSEIGRIQQLLDQMIVSSEIQMADIVWEEDSLRARQVAESLSRTTDISYVRASSTNKPLAQIGTPSSNMLTRTIPLHTRHGEMTPTAFGEFTLGVDMDAINLRLRTKLIDILIRTTLLIFLNIGLVLLLFRIMVTRHLRQIGRFFSSLNANTLEQPLLLDRAPPRPDGGDEFDDLVRGVGRMQATLASDIRRRQRAEDEVRQLNEALEATVAERTAELTAKNRQLESLSLTDRLTGLANRRQLDTLLEHELARCERNQGELSLIMLDIDHFKEVNDTWGHQVGDTVLVEVAEVLKGNIRKFDVLGRWGGEEFLILCSDGMEGALIVAEKLRRALEAHAIEPCGPRTASFGVSAYRPNDDIEALIHRADTALYLAKNAGRNCVVAA